MSDLMPCQMCGGKAELEDSSYNMIEFRVDCTNDDCLLSGPTICFDECDQREEAIKLASERWNQMQAYIARGKLLDEPTNNKRSKSL